MNFLENSVQSTLMFQFDFYVNLWYNIIDFTDTVKKLKKEGNLMTIEDFRKEVRKLTWTEDIKEVFEREAERILNHLFDIIQKCNFVDCPQENNLRSFPLSDREDLEVSVLIYPYKSLDSVPKIYELSFHRNFFDRNIYVDSYSQVFNFEDSLFTKNAMSNETDGSNIYQVDCENVGFQIFQELFCMDFLPMFLKKHGIKSKRTYIYDEDESAFLTFKLPSKWFLT